MSLLTPAGFDADGNLLVQTSRETSPERAAITLGVSGSRDACGPMDNPASRVAAIRRSLVCLPNRSLRALDVSADGSRAIVALLDGAPVVAYRDEGSLAHLYDVGAARLESRIPNVFSDSYLGEPIGDAVALSPNGTSHGPRRARGRASSRERARRCDAARARLALRRGSVFRALRRPRPHRSRVGRGVDQLRTNRRLSVVSRIPTPTSGYYPTTLSDGSRVQHRNDRTFVRTTRDGATRTFQGGFRALSANARFLARCEDGALLVDALTDESAPSARVGSCANLPAWAELALRNDERVVAIAEGDRLTLARVGTDETIKPASTSTISDARSRSPTVRSA